MTPGPGAYSPAMIKKSGSSSTFKGKYAVKKPESSPGPGAYCSSTSTFSVGNKGIPITKDARFKINA